MPNWCGNVLTIQGESEALDALETAVKGSDDNGSPLDFSLEAIAPTPEALKGRGPKSFSPVEIERMRSQFDAWKHSIGEERLREMIEHAENQYADDPQYDALTAEYGSDNWYDWRFKHWGTKWELDGVQRKRAPGSDLLHYTFATAWSPPKPAIELLSGRFPTLFFHLNYEESGADIAGCIAYRAGRRVMWSDGSWASAITGAYAFRRELLALGKDDEDDDDLLDQVYSALSRDM